MTDEVYRKGGTPTLRLQFRKEDGSTPLDLTSLALTLLIDKPDGTKITRTPTVTTPPGTNGNAHYDVQAADFDMEGTWRFQGRAVGGGRVWYSDIHHRDVLEILE